VAYVTDNKETILAIIDGWSGKLTYELLSEKLQLELGLKRLPSRHTYLKHDEIKHAFDLKKEELRNKKSTAIEEAKSLFESSDKLSHLLANLRDDDATIAELIKRVEKLENENEKLCSENNRLGVTNDKLLERFARWQHNLQKMDGVDMNKLATRIDIGLPQKSKR
tara:strand:+ start:5184 stop:5681 length:498 start_codon:yes stop_codon:yes gene_type:complete